MCYFNANATQNVEKKGIEEWTREFVCSLEREWNGISSSKIIDDDLHTAGRSSIVSCIVNRNVARAEIVICRYLSAISECNVCISVSSYTSIYDSVWQMPSC